MKVVGAILVLVIVPLLVMALHGSSPWLAKKLIQRTARRLPGPYGDRYEEEWLGELAAMPDGGLATLVYALFIRLGAARMGRALGVSSAPRQRRRFAQLEIDLTRNGKRYRAYVAFRTKARVPLPVTVPISADDVLRGDGTSQLPIPPQ
jgi:hypothetical protein